MVRAQVAAGRVCSGPLGTGTGVYRLEPDLGDLVLRRVQEPRPRARGQVTAPPGSVRSGDASFLQPVHNRMFDAY